MFSKLSVDGYQLTSIHIAYVVIFVATAIQCYLKWTRRRFEKLASIMPGPKSYPIIGSGYMFTGSLQKITETLFKFIEIYGSHPFCLWIGPRFVVSIGEPEDLQIVLNSSKALEKDVTYRFYQNILGESLITAPVHKWRKHRRLITPLFSTNLFENFIPIFNEKNQILIKNLKKEVGKTQPFDLWPLVSDTAMNTICQTAMDYNIDSQPKVKYEYASAFIKAIELDSERVIKPWLYPDIMFSAYIRLLGLKDVFKTSLKLPIKVIKEKEEVYERKKAEKKSIDDTDGEKKRSKVFLDALLELNKDEKNFSQDELIDEVTGIIITGSETSALTVCFCLLMLAIHPDIQEKVYDEIYEVLGDDDRPVTIEDTTKLIYLEQTLRETLRLYPVAPLFFRRLQDDVKIASGNYILPKDTVCAISPIRPHYNPKLYPNPYSFNPENFSAENVGKRHKYSFLAFSGGPRNCIGYKYGILSMKVSLSMILRNFSVHTDVKMSDIKLKCDMGLKSVHGYPVTIRTRDRRPTYKRSQTVEANNCL